MNNVYINNIWNRIKVIKEKNRRKVLYRKKLFKLLTIDEAEKIYTSYVSKELIVNKIDFRTKKKIKQRVPFWKIKLNIKMKVTNEQMIHVIPRLEEVEY